MFGALAGVDGENGNDDEEAHKNNQNDSHSFADGLFERVHIWRGSGLSGGEGDVGEENEIDEDMINEKQRLRGHVEEGRRRRRRRRREKEEEKQRDKYEGFEFD